MAKPHIAAYYVSDTRYTLQTKKQHELNPITEEPSRLLFDEDGDCIGRQRGNQLEIQYKSRNAGETRITKYLLIDLPISLRTETRSKTGKRTA